MINFSFKNAAMWVGQSGSLYLEIINTGPEDLYCSNDFSKKKGNILISALELVPCIGQIPEALADKPEDLDFQIDFQEDLYKENPNYSAWECSYKEDTGMAIVRAEDGIACLRAGAHMRIKIILKKANVPAGLGKLDYRFRDWEIVNMEEEKVSSFIPAGALYVSKLPLPTMELVPAVGEDRYPYNEECDFEWKIKNIDGRRESYKVYIDAEEQKVEQDMEQEVDLVLKGETTLFLKDTPHALALLDLVNCLSAQKNFYPRWFILGKMNAPEKNKPKEKHTITLWWNLTESDKCYIQDKEVSAKDHRELFSVEEDRFTISLSYYDSENMRQYLSPRPIYPDSSDFYYERPRIDYFGFEPEKLQNGMEADFLSVDEITGKPPIVNTVYGDFEPVYPKKIDLYIKGECKNGNCYISVNNGSILTIMLQDLKEGKAIRVNESGSGKYKLEFWDDYGYKTEMELDK